MCNNRDQVVNEKDNFLLFIELINVFKSIFLSSHHLKLKNDYIIIMLRNFIMKHVYKSSILSLRYSIIVFSKTNITINNIIFFAYFLLRSIRIIYIFYFDEFNI